MTILRLSAAIYPVGSWLHSSPEASSEDGTESWGLRSSLASWSWRAIDELRGDEVTREYASMLPSRSGTILTD